MFKIDTPEFFYREFVGKSPNDELLYHKTKAMIQHYCEAGLDTKLLQIYEYCAPFEVVDTQNIPCHLWDSNNLLEQDEFYYHPELQIRNQAPTFDPETGKTSEPLYYCEPKEYYDLTMVIGFSRQINPKQSVGIWERDRGTALYLFKKLRNIDPEELDNFLPLDILLAMIQQNNGNLDINTLNQPEVLQEALGSLRERRARLIDLDRDHYVWRYPL